MTMTLTCCLCNIELYCISYVKIEASKRIIIYAKIIMVRIIVDMEVILWKLGFMK